MRAIGNFAPGQSDCERDLREIDAQVPVPGPRDLLVQAKAISLNPVDICIRAAGAPANGNAQGLGWDVTGRVMSIGCDVRDFREGDPVFYAGDTARSGATNEYHLVDERIVARKPESLDWAAAAALPLSSITAWQLLFDRVRLPFGEKTKQGALLIVDGAGGVGSMLIQLARRLTGLTVIASASDPRSIAWVREMGAHHVVDHTLELDEELQRIGMPEVEYIASLTGSDQRVEVFSRILKMHGHLALADDPERFDVVAFRRKSVTISWEQACMRPTFETKGMGRQRVILQEIADLVDAGVLRSPMTRQEAPISVETLRRAHEFGGRDPAIGKMVVSGFSRSRPRSQHANNDPSCLS
jgi:zinc-binding alcohol dehydrogenase family protein